MAGEFTVVRFLPWPDYNAGVGQWLNGDFNKDGKTDFIHIVPLADYLHIWISKGDGTFQVSTYRPWAGYGTWGTWLTGDFNKDGRTDLAHVIPNTDYLNIWTSNGDGTFEVKSFRPWAFYGTWGTWLTGDFNRDGRTDLVQVIPNTDHLDILTSIGDGTFDVNSVSPWTGYGMWGTWLTGDFNKDGRTDLVHVVKDVDFVLPDADYVHVWTSKSDGTFDINTFFPWSGYGSSGTWLTGDFNRDGMTDLVHIVANTDYMHIWTSKGDGTFDLSSFRPWTGYGMDWGAWLTGDFNDDGMTDLIHVVPNSDYAHIWISGGGGQFNITRFSPWEGYPSTSGAWLTGDINGDGKTDAIHASDKANIWFSRYDRFWVEGIEITQGIQNMKHDVPLIAYKLTVVRAYVGTNSASPIRLRAKLKVRWPDGSEEIVESPKVVAIVDPAENGNIKLKREAKLESQKSLYFFLHPGRTREGRLIVNIEELIDDPSSLAMSCANCPSEEVRVYLHSGSFSLFTLLNTKMIGFYTHPTDERFLPKGIDIKLTDSWLRRSYPVWESLFSASNENPTSFDDVLFNDDWTPSNCGKANSALLSIRAKYVDAAGSDAEKRRQQWRHYIGLVHDGGSRKGAGSQFIRGCSAGIPGPTEPPSVATAPVGTDSWGGWDNDGSYGDWSSGHELAHTFGLNHVDNSPAACGQESNPANPFETYPFPGGPLSDDSGSFVGFDTGDAYARFYPTRKSPSNLPVKVLPGTSTYDVMTYCANLWLSSYTYKKIFCRMKAEAAFREGQAAKPCDDKSRFLFGLSDPVRLVNFLFENEADPANGKGTDGESNVQAIVGHTDTAKLKLARKSSARIQTGAAVPSKLTTGKEHAGTSARQAGEKPKPKAARSAALPVPGPSLSSPPSVHLGLVVTPDTSQPSSSLMPSHELRRGNFLHVVATVNLTSKTAEIQYISQVSSVMLPIHPKPSELSVRLMGTNNRLLSQSPASLLEHSDPLPNEDRTALIDVAIPFFQDVVRLELVLSEKVIAFKNVGPNPPTLEIIDVQPQLVGKPAKRSLVLSWSGNDLDGDKLKYSVLISGDGGETWRLLAFDIRESRFIFKADHLKCLQRPTTMVRVDANDGLHTTVKTKEFLRLSELEPQLSMNHSE